MLALWDVKYAWMQSLIAKAQYQLDANDLALILTLTRAGTLVEAAARLNIDPSTVFRSLQRIEKGLGQSLFNRSRTGYHATELAHQLAQYAERMEIEMEAARSAVQAQPDRITGTVRITTTDTLLHGLVLPALRSLAIEHPLLQLELMASNDVASLTKRDADIAVRATKAPPDHLIGKHLGTIHVAMFVPTGHPASSIGEVVNSRLPWIAPDDALPEHPSVQWRRRNHPKIVPRYKVNSILAVTEAVAAGLGVGLIPLFLARGRRDIVQISAPLEGCETQLWLLAHPELRYLRRVSTVFSHLADHLTLD